MVGPSWSALGPGVGLGSCHLATSGLAQHDVALFFGFCPCNVLCIHCVRPGPEALSLPQECTCLCRIPVPCAAFDESLCLALHLGDL